MFITLDINELNVNNLHVKNLTIDSINIDYLKANIYIKLLNDFKNEFIIFIIFIILAGLVIGINLYINVKKYMIYAKKETVERYSNLENNYE